MKEYPSSTVTRLKDSVEQESGPFHGGVLSSIVRPDRVDWTLTPDGSEPTTTGFELVGSLGDLLSPFVETMQRWFDLETCPELRRMAFGAALLLLVDGKEAGYRQLQAYLPSVELDPNSSDFLYRINRPRQCSLGIEGLQVNRLSSWSVALVRKLALDFASGSLHEQEERQDFHACRLELDMNTAADWNQTLPAERTPEILTELVQLGKEIAEEGDIR